MGRALSVIGVPTGAAEYSAALEGLTALDVYLLQEDPTIPRLHDAGVRYTKDATNGWRTIKDVLGSKDGDCEALSSWRAAELRVSGEDPNAHVHVYQTGPKKFHAIVMRGDGQLEDPSIDLGMKPPKGLVQRYAAWNNILSTPLPDDDSLGPEAAVMGYDDVACIGIAADSDPDFGDVSFDVERTEDGHWRGILRIPLCDGRAIYGQTSPSKTSREAEHKNNAVLGLVGSVWDDLAALAPTAQVAAAINLARNQHVQNLAKAAWNKGKHLINPSSDPNSPEAAAKRADARAANYAALQPDAVLTPDEYSDAQMMDGSGSMREQFDQGDVPGPQLDMYEVNGVEVAPHELNHIDRINAALLAGSRPSVGTTRSTSSAAPTHTTSTATRAPVAAAPRAAPAPVAAAPVMHAAPTPAQAMAAYGAAALTPTQLASAIANPTAVNPGFTPAVAALYSPYGPTAYGPGSSSYTPAQQQAYAQQHAAALAMLAAGGGDPGSGGGGGGGGDSGGSNYEGQTPAFDQELWDAHNAIVDEEAQWDAWAAAGQTTTPEEFFQNDLIDQDTKAAMLSQTQQYQGG